MIVDCPAHLLEGETGVYTKLVSEDMKRRSNLHTHMILANIECIKTMDYKIYIYMYMSTKLLCECLHPLKPQHILVSRPFVVDVLALFM